MLMNDKKTILLSTGMTLKLTIDANGQILYPATMTGMVS